ncbi:hypothetical protein [Polyangium jinanense]|uniref:Uncharacterized protein n=1 Tax=Polyangium jinanense TaxID=2829994 RepID=A0A9X3X7W7_9BACT|nr:hypothetical protein [Polyangium jinanense]MDC3959958.1 hypothetical protein [Polyangium jinanense]MDC3983838.1 hypothetical protein [Polyangium jinanense]
MTFLLTASGWTVEQVAHGRCIRAFITTRDEGDYNVGHTVLLYEPITP